MKRIVPGLQSDTKVFHHMYHIWASSCGPSHLLFTTYILVQPLDHFNGKVRGLPSCMPPPDTGLYNKAYELDNLPPSPVTPPGADGDTNSMSQIIYFTLMLLFPALQHHHKSPLGRPPQRSGQHNGLQDKPELALQSRNTHPRLPDM